MAERSVLWRIELVPSTNAPLLEVAQGLDHGGAAALDQDHEVEARDGTEEAGVAAEIAEVLAEVGETAGVAVRTEAKVIAEV